ASVLRLPVLLTGCLLSSSWTIHRAVAALRRGEVRSFARSWVATIVLGAVFLGGTALEWRHLIRDEGLTIRTNLFGTTYYSLVGLHAFHVTVGLIALATVALLTAGGHVNREHAARVDLLGLYWQFVGGVGRALAARNRRGRGPERGRHRCLASGGKASLCRRSAGAAGPGSRGSAISSQPESAAASPADS